VVGRAGRMRVAGYGTQGCAAGARGYRPETERRLGKSQRLVWLGRACEGAAQVILGIGMVAREARTAESEDRLDLVHGDAAAQQTLGDPEIGNAPIGRRETLRNPQAVQPSGINVVRSGWSKGAAQRNAWWRRKAHGGARRRKVVLVRLDQRGGVGGQVRMSVNQFYPRRITAGQTACGFLVGESSQPSAVTPIRAGTVGAVQSSQASGDRGRHSRRQRSEADADPGLQMPGAGAQHDRRFMPVKAHDVDALVVGAIEIDKDIAGVARSLEGMEEDVISLAIAQSQKSEQGAGCELDSRPNAVSGKWFAAVAVNQTNLIIIARHGGELTTDGLPGDEESAIHDRHSNIGSGSPLLKAEVLTLQKSGSFHFALTSHIRNLTSRPPF
jgi:hypothetical protein